LEKSTSYFNEGCDIENKIRPFYDAVPEVDKVSVDDDNYYE